MFFVGATGQLLTLILTVCLPCIFLFSGEKLQPVEAPASLLVIHQNQNEISFKAATVVEYNASVVAEKQNRCIVNGYPEIQKIPFNDFQVRWKSVYSTSTGNKAPPVFFFSC